MDKAFPKQWFNGLQALRGMLFLLVFLSHSGAFFPSEGLHGAMGVSVFFVLSGFLHGVRPVVREGSLIRQCVFALGRKLSRFWLVYIAVLPIAAMLRPCSWGDVLKCVFLVQSYFGDATDALRLNWPTWFLSSIMLCYLLAPALNRFLRRSGAAAPLTIVPLWVMELLWAVVWLGCKATASDPGYYWVYICPLARLVDFTIGLALGVGFSLRSQQSARSPVSSIVHEGIAIGIALLSLLECGHCPVSFAACSLWVPSAVALTWVFAECSGALTRACDARWLMWFGQRSFELYIVHRMVLLFIARTTAARPVSWVLALLLTCVFAELLATAASAARSWAGRAFAMRLEGGS